MATVELLCVEAQAGASRVCTAMCTAAAQAAVHTPPPVRIGSGGAARTEDCCWLSTLPLPSDALTFRPDIVLVTSVTELVRPVIVLTEKLATLFLRVPLNSRAGGVSRFSLLLFVYEIP